MSALLWLLSRDALALDLLLGVPIRNRPPFSAFTTEIANGQPMSEELHVEPGFRGELAAAIPFQDLGSTSAWIVEVGFREWTGTAGDFRFAAHEPRADIGLQLATRREETVHPYAAMGIGVLTSIVASSDWSTYGLVSPHAFLAAGAAFGGETRGLFEARVSPVLRDDTYTRETLLEHGSAGLRFSPGGAAFTVAVGVRFL
jgi:hypothetical protein